MCLPASKMSPGSMAAVTFTKPDPKSNGLAGLRKYVSSDVVVFIV